MDLSTIKGKLDSGQYGDPWSFVDDVWLMFDNAWLYNKKSSRVYKCCTKVRKIPLDFLKIKGWDLGQFCSLKCSAPTFLGVNCEVGVCSQIVPRSFQFRLFATRIFSTFPLFFSEFSEGNTILEKFEWMRQCCFAFDSKVSDYKSAIRETCWASADLPKCTFIGTRQEQISYQREDKIKIHRQEIIRHYKNTHIPLC